MNTISQIIERITSQKQLPSRWPNDVTAESLKLSENTEFCKKQYRDLCSLAFITIDDETARDFDDAVFCTSDHNQWKLYVAIADVASYVLPGSAIDREAARRGNSTYFCCSVIPMLPEILSNDICSLKPDHKRRCIVCEMDIDCNGKIINFSFYHAVIKSHARLTYNAATELINGAGSSCDPQVLKNIDNLSNLFDALVKARIRRNTMEGISREYRFVLNQTQTGASDVVLQKQDDAHKLIEECMIAANISAAEFILTHRKNAIFRIQSVPQEDKIRQFRNLTASEEISLSGGYNPTTTDINNYIKSTSRQSNAAGLHSILARLQEKAVYSTENEGHYALALHSYVHFTSPIRRYADLVTHRIIKICIAEDLKNNQSQTESPAPAQEKGSVFSFFSIFKSHKPQKIPQPVVKNDIHITGAHLYSKNELASIANHCTETEISSKEAVRESEKWLISTYMQDKIGQIYNATVTNVKSFGLFIMTDDREIEGFIYVGTLGTERFSLNSANNSLVGQNTSTRFYCGQRLAVKLAAVDINEGKIRFVPA